MKQEKGLPPVIKEKKESDFNEKLKRSWYYFAAGVALAAIGVGVALAGNSADNPILIALGAPMAVAGGWLFKLGLDNFGVRTIKGKKVDSLNPPNSLIIQSKTVAFEHLDDPQNIPQKCLNDGKYYHLFFKGAVGKDDLTDFALPDSNPDDVYFDPGEALNVIRMEATRKYLNYAPADAPPVKLIIIGVVIGLLIIGIIAV